MTIMIYTHNVTHVVQIKYLEGLIPESKAYFLQYLLTLPKCRLLCDVDYEAMPSSSVFTVQ